MTTQSAARRAVFLQKKVTCPHCWHGFAPEEALWIAQHAELVGDPKLGPDHQQRFLPSRMTVSGDALDPRGFQCTSLACPKCHLEVPRAMFEMGAMFNSILGAPASGKSFFLAAMTWQLRQILPRDFALSFSDVDPTSNRNLSEYEELLFLNSNADRPVAIRKTELQGELYDTVLYGDQAVSYPRPFMFGMKPVAHHPNYESATRLGRVLCLYDNAGEHFLPGQDTVGSPVTRHLAQSSVLFYLFDPTQDPRFRAACRHDSANGQSRTVRQETILHEAANRVRRYTGLSQHTKNPRPLIVVVTKLDVWRSLLDQPVLPAAWTSTRRNGADARPQSAGQSPAAGAKPPTRKSVLCALNMQRVLSMSDQIHKLLSKYSPEVVSTAEGFANEVYFVPVSATGCAPERDPQTGMLGIRPGNMKPEWVEVPMLFALSRWGKGLIPYFE